jgi:hypothetical protein
MIHPIQYLRNTAWLRNYLASQAKAEAVPAHPSPTAEEQAKLARINAALAAPNDKFDRLFEKDPRQEKTTFPGDLTQAFAAPEVEGVDAEVEHV